MLSKYLHLDESITSLRNYFSSQATKNLTHRIQSLQNLKKAILEREPQILNALAKDLGKPAVEAFVSEVGFVIDDINRTLKSLPQWAEPQKVSTPMMLFPANSHVRFEPRGVCLIISPWNYPFQLLISPLIGAIAAGNCVVVKPSELAPHTSKVLKELIDSTFRPDFVCCLEGGRELSESLLQKKWDHIFFTGSTQVGKIVMRAAAEHLTPLTLELGGKSPCIFDKGIPLERACKRLAWGKFFNVGQTCVAPDYLLVHKNDFSNVVKTLSQEITQFYGNNPLESPDLGRIINDSHFTRVQSLISQGEVLFGGASDPSTLKISPTLLKPHSLESPLMRDEIFGPLLPIIPYNEFEDAISFVNERPKPLALYLFTQNKDVENQVLDSCSFGGGCINDTIMHLANHSIPFGGVGDSGFGSYHGHKSFETFSHAKGILKNTLNFEVELRYPPYQGDLIKKLRFLQRS